MTAEESARLLYHGESLASFFGFAAESLGIDSRLKGDFLQLEVDPQRHPQWPKPHKVRVAVTREAIELRPKRVLSPAEAAQWIWRRATTTWPALNARPAMQPEAVHEFSNRLFAAYQIDGGQVRLAGCRLEDVPFIRLTVLRPESPWSVEHLFYTTDATPVDEGLLTLLGLLEVRPLGDHTPACTRDKAKCLMDLLAEQVQSAGERFVAVTIVGAKWASGNVQFEIGDQAAQVSFSDWTSTLQPPPFVCPASGKSSYHLAAVDDGRIVAAEAIVKCEESGRRVVDCERVTCGVTGKLVDATLTSICPATSAPALQSEFVGCAACQQLVSRTAIDRHGTCQMCDSLPRASRDDHSVSVVIARYPALGRFKRFRAAEQSDVVRVEALGWNRLLVAIGPASETLAVARRGRFKSTWRQVPREEWTTILGEG